MRWAARWRWNGGGGGGGEWEEGGHPGLIDGGVGGRSEFGVGFC